MSQDVVPVVAAVAHDDAAKQIEFYELQECPDESVSLLCNPARLVEQSKQRFSAVETHSFGERIGIASEST